MKEIVRMVDLKVQQVLTGKMPFAAVQDIETAGEIKRLWTGLLLEDFYQYVTVPDAKNQVGV